MEAAADNQGDSRPDAHAADQTCVRELELCAQAGRRLEGHERAPATIRKGTVVDAAAPGQEAAVADECGQAPGDDLLPQAIGILARLNVAFDQSGVVALVTQTGAHDVRDTVTQQRCSGLPQDAAAGGRQAHGETGFDYP